MQATPCWTRPCQLFSIADVAANVLPNVNEIFELEHWNLEENFVADVN
jgi:hypothetical protein